MIEVREEKGEIDVVIEQNTLSLDKMDCQLIEARLKNGEHIREILVEKVQPMYKGDIDELEGIEIPADYWYFVNELSKEISL